MDNQGEKPEYRVISDSFFEPNHVLRGSVVRTWTSPGPHLQPLNDAAIAKMEAWYREEIEELDIKTRQPTGKKIYPHEQYRVAAGVPGEKHDTEIVSAPPKDLPGTLSLPEQMAGMRVNTDQRPPPAQVFQQAVSAAVEVGLPAPSEAFVGPAGLVTPAPGDGPPVVEVALAAKPPSAKRIA